MIIREGQPFVARVMIGNRIVGFATTVLRSCAVPYRYLHLSYPEEMEQITVHKAQRVRVKLFASAKNSNPEFQSDKPQPATVVDISTSGAQAIAGDPLGDVGDRLQLNCLIKVGTSEKLLAIPALLRNVHLENESGSENYSHGLEFELTDQQDISALHGFVYEQIVKLRSDQAGTCPTHLRARRGEREPAPSPYAPGRPGNVRHPAPPCSPNPPRSRPAGIYGPQRLRPRTLPLHCRPWHRRRRRS
jgi:c-di-GMP-binding flagellar brake protein YcgR